MTPMPLTGSAGTEAGAYQLSKWPGSTRHAFILTLALWFIPMLVVGIIVALRPTYRTVTIDSYHFSAEQWWAGKSLYTGPRGMNYLPHFAILFSPFHALPFWLGEVLWRLLALVALVWGLWRVVRTVFRDAPERAFFWATLGAMPLCMSALRNGNANAHFGAVLLLAIAAIIHSRWWMAAVLIMLLIAVKPLGIVLALLAPLCYAPLRWRLPVALVGLALFPFLFARPEYVVTQYREAWGNLQACAVVTQHRFADINGILRTLGVPLTGTASTLTRVLAGGFTALLFWTMARRLREPLTALWLYVLTSGYLMLFNPMTESNSYVILAPAFGLWAAWFLFKQTGPARRLGWVLLAMALSMGLLPNVVRPLFGNYFALIWLPLMSILLLVLLGRFLCQSGSPMDASLSLQPDAGPASVRHSSK